MKLSTWACAWALSGCLLTGNLMAQGLRQPFSVRPAGFDYNRYLQEGAAASPSDQPAPVVDAAPAQPAPVVEAAPAQPAPAAPVAAAAPVVSSGCNSCAPSCAPSCDPCNSCYSCNDCGCGLGLDGLFGGCCLGEPITLKSHLLCEDSAWNVGGWTQIGYHDEASLLPNFNVHPDRVNLHQQWFFLEKVASASECEWDFGFRGDIMYGVDAADTQAFGNTVDGAGNNRGFDSDWDHGIYGFALPQLYAEVARGDLSVKLGHFYTIVGYESVMAPSNFFYSHAYTMYNSEPFTHTGVLATYKVDDTLSVWGGWSLGWDTGFDQFEDGSSFLGGFTKQVTDDVKLIYASVVGDFGWRGDQAYVHSVIADMALTEKLQYVFQTDFLTVDETQEDNVAIVNYLFYTVNDCLKLGTRVEWWQTDPLTPGAGNVSVNEATFGLNYKPHANFVIRPEVRQEWIPAADTDVTIFGIDAIATY